VGGKRLLRNEFLGSIPSQNLQQMLHDRMLFPSELVGCFSLNRPTMAIAVNCGSAAGQASIVPTCWSSLDANLVL